MGPNNIRRLDAIDSPIENDEYRVAMKCRQGNRPDYHFIRQDENGWYNKSGDYIGLYVDVSSVEAEYWYPTGIDPLTGELVIMDNEYFADRWYDDETIYFAIKEGWDK